MKTEQALGLTFFVMAWTMIIFAYMKYTQTSFVLNHETYEQVGVMAYQDSGIYIPVYKKRG